MKKITLTLIFAYNTIINAQNIGISSTGSVPNGGAGLDVNFSDKGMLIPRVSLSNVSTYSPPITGGGPAKSMLVYNTNTAVVGGNGEGFYYWDSVATKWKYIAAPANGPGSAGQVLTSQGPNNPPQWSTLSVGGGITQGSALGTAMMTAYMDSIGLFRPHTNTCNATTEAFVPLYSGATVGFCIEKNESPVASWTEAIRTCLSLGKRLPEPWEWQVACDNATTLGLFNMTNNWEWASNFALPIYYGGSTAGVAAAVFGNSGCNYASWDWLGNNLIGARAFAAFRCVR